MTPERHAKLSQILARRQPDLTLIADQVNKPRNLAAMIRNCDAVGVHAIHAVIPKEGYRDYRGTALGSNQWVKRYNHDDISAAFAAVKAQGMKVYAAHFTDKAVDYRSVDYTQPCAILMGAEKQGVSDYAAEHADAHIIIPMMGMVSSLNVSTAAGIILVEAQQQRIAKGMYDAPRLEQSEIAQTLFEWGNREVAQYCRERGLAYPPYDDAGEILDAPGWYARARAGEAPVYDWSAEPV